MRLTRSTTLLAVLGLCAALVGCSEQSSTKAGAGAAPSKTQVSVVTLHPQSVTITAELPGRTSSSLEAEVRPQVTGIITDRLFEEGSEVEKGAALYKIDSAGYKAALDIAKAQLQQAEAAVPSAQAKADRYAKLSKNEAISEQDVDDAKAALDEANAAVAAAKASVETAKIDLDHTTITAPISGRIDKSSLTVGALVTASQSDALTTIHKINPINVDVTQSSTNLLNLRQAIAQGRVRISGEGVKVKLMLENGMVYPVDGKLEFSESTVSETTGTYTLRAVFDNPDRLLLPGMYVHAMVEEGVADNSFLVPQRAVSRNTDGQATAYFVNGDGQVEQRVLDVGRSVGNNWLVNAGVEDGDRVIVEGSQYVREGQDVDTVEVTIDETTGEVESRDQSLNGAPKSSSDVAARTSASATKAN
ncbi:efflux RND transporter periplasmic adaptor subunit [Martelella alba]|uniref:Efflux RND transporter periplasmic adaptor subunit n=1 Tax=Martelella alba TaxID=2590451 RepID=A0A506U7G3_9HYPH|nr:efflux RND transporter periplasmic adaptor subunit [Martelella alba]TPW28895.1 efflux RND transporter periplasmic adaptor subunit [Martelella alba]